MKLKTKKIGIRALCIFLMLLIGIPYALGDLAAGETADADTLVWIVSNYLTERDIGSYSDTLVDDNNYWCTGYDDALDESENQWYTVLDFDLSSYGIAQGGLDSLTFEWRGYAGGWGSACDPGKDDNPECLDTGVCEPSYIRIWDWDSGSWDVFHTTSYTLDTDWDTSQKTISRTNATPENGWISTSGVVRMAFEHHETGMNTGFETKIATDYADLDVTYTIDTTPPVITFVSPTPNNETRAVADTYINVTADETLSEAKLEWNGTNETMSGSGTNWYLNKTGLYNGNYTFRVWGRDSLGNWGVTETRWVYINYTTASVAGNIKDDAGSAVTCNVSAFNENDGIESSSVVSSFSLSNVHSGWYVQFNCSDTENVSAKFRISGDSPSVSIRVNDFGGTNPVGSDPTGVSIKFVNVSAYGLAFGSVEVKIYYGDVTVGGADEHRLSIYHYTGGSWAGLSTTLDTTADTVTGTTTSLSPFGVTYSTPSGTGNYRTSDLPPEVELSSNLTKSCGLDSSGNPTCHLVKNSWPNPNNPGDTVDPYLNGGDHPGENRGVAGFFPEFVHRHHGGSNWPLWRYNASSSQDVAYCNPKLNMTEPWYGLLDSGFDENEYGGKGDIAIKRNRYEAGRGGIGFDTTPFMGDPDGDNDQQYVMATCSWADTRALGNPSIDTGGCHGIKEVGSTLSDTSDIARTDSITCTVCHNESGAGTLAINHGSKSDCGECHFPGYTAGTTLDGNNPDAANQSNYCDENCHTQMAATELRNTTYMHAGVDCRFCHGHAHNVSGYYDKTGGTWNITCGSSDDVCHGAGATEPRNVGTVNHNVSGAGTGPDCDDCHTTQTGVGKGHNITVPSCSKCHNRTSTWGAAATNTTIPAWTDQEYISVTGASATHGHNTSYGGRGTYTNLSCKFCHNATSYHNPGLKYGSGGAYNNCNNTQCHGTGGAGQTVNTTHSDVACAACHNNDTIKSASSSGAVSLGTNIHASNSSWMIPFNITADNLTNSQCILCHDNSSYIDPTLECNTCHATTEIHDPEMGFAGVVVGDGIHDLPNPNCVYCHDIAGDGPAPASAKINVSKMNATGATHTDVNNGTTPSSDWTNRMCWACHTNDSVRVDNRVDESELPTKAHPDKYKNATCRYCHDNVSRLMNYSNQNQSYVEANYYKNFTTFNASVHARGHIEEYPELTFFQMKCWDCHDQHAATPQDCTKCHDNRTKLQSLDDSITPTISGLLYQNYTAFNSSAHRYGNLTNHGLSDVDLVTFNCPDCHNTHTVSLLHCKDCHGNKTLMNDTYLTGTAWENNESVLNYIYKNYTKYNSSAHAQGTITSLPGQTFFRMECWDCHDAHAATPQECADCHDNQSHLVTLDDSINSTVAAAIYKNNTAFSASGHAQGRIDDEFPGQTFFQMTCSSCHDSHAVSPQDCRECHDNQSHLQTLDSSINATVAAVLYQNYTAFNSSAHRYGNLTNHGLSDVDLVTFNCPDCHSSHEVELLHCKDCHGNKTLMNDTYLTGTAWENNESVLNYVYKNYTKYNLSAHGNGSISSFPGQSFFQMECWDCHDAHAATPQECHECHDNQSHLVTLDDSINATVAAALYKNYTAFNASSHGRGHIGVFPGQTFFQMKCWDCHDAHAATPQECQDCHNNQSHLQTLDDSINATVAAALYKNYTIFNESAHGNGSISAFPGQSFFQMVCTDCHDSHATTAQNCQDCHNNQSHLQTLDSSINATVAVALYKNETTFNASAHAQGHITTFPGQTFFLMGCTDCHDSHAVSPQDCRECHDNQSKLQTLDDSINATVAAALYKNYTIYNASAHGGGNLSMPGLEGVDIVAYDCQDCHSSHEVSVTPCQNCHDNRTWLNNTITPQIGENATVLEYLYMNYTSFNASSHGDGVECYNCHNAHNVASLEYCTDCHYNGSDPDALGNFSAPLVYEHIPTPSGNVNTTAACESCHNNSVLTSASNDLRSLSLKANVSHYLTNESLHPGGNATTDCTTCHKNATISDDWYLPQRPYVNYTIRHGEDNATFCGKCHNSTSAQSFHAEKTYLPWYVHKEYDWEDDDDNEAKRGAGNGTSWKWESCIACHNTTDPLDVDLYPRRTCEDCHLNGSIGPYNKSVEGQFFLRNDWRESIPLVYEHIFENATYTNTTGDIANVTGVEVSTSNVSELVTDDVGPPPSFSLKNSTCMGWNNGTMTGVCHGVPSTNTSDGFYAFSNKSADIAATNASYYPYVYNAPVDWLPDTTNCTYCHTGNASVRWQWGNAADITASTKRNHTGIDTSSTSKCWECHVNASEPFNFHSMELNNGVGGPDCVGCHDIGRSYAPDVDVANMNASTSIHKDLNNATANTTILTDMIDKACWSCHGDGSQPVSHPSRYRTPRECPDCHTNNTGGYNEATGKGNYSAPFIYEHNPFSTGDVTTTAQCWDCHNQSVAANADAENGTTINNSKKSNVSHYGIIAGLLNSTNCIDCHINEGNRPDWGNPTQVTSSMGTTNAQCYLCHMDTVSVAPNTTIGFHEGNVTEWNWNSCDICHYTGGRRS